MAEAFHSQEPTLIIVEQPSFAPELLQPGFGLDVLKLDDLLLTPIEEAADGHTQNPPRPEREGHESRWKSAGFRRRQVKSAGGNGRISRASVTKWTALQAGLFF